MIRLSYLQRIAFALVVMAVTCSSSSFSQEPEQSPLFHPWTWERDHYRQHLENLNATTDSNFTVLGRWAWGPCQAVDVRDNYAYIGNGSTFQVLDVVDSSAPTIAGEYVADWIINDIRLRDTLAFVATEATLLILNIANPQQPSRLGEIFNSSGTLRVALGDSFAYVTTYLGSLRVVDISSPASPYFRGAIAVGGEYPWCLAARGRYAYVGNIEWPNVAVVNATNPDFLTVTTLNTNGLAFAGAVRDTLLFLAVRVPGARFQVYNISTPGTPVLISQMNLPFIGVEAMTIHGQTAFVSSKDSGVVAIDITDPQQPQLMGLHRRRVKSFAGIYTALAATQFSLFVAYYDGLGILSLANIDSLRQVSFFPTGGSAEKIFLKDTLAYVASGYAGLWILDISTPRQPRPVSSVFTGGGYASDVVVGDSFAYVVNRVLYATPDTARGLWVVDIRNPMQPQIVSHHAGIARYPNIVAPNRLALEGNLLLMTQPDNPANDTTLEIIDISDPRQLNTLSIVRGQYSLAAVALKDSIGYLGRSDSGLKVLDLHNPNSPFLLSSLFNRRARGIVLRDDFAYVDRVDTFFVVDVADPSSPAIVGQGGGLSSSTGGRDLAISSNYVYSAEGALTSFDVKDPTSPRLRGVFQKRFSRGGVRARGPFVYLTDGIYGIWFLQNDLMTFAEQIPGLVRDFTLSQNYPNPFNPSTNIKFQIPIISLVNLRVYDILGREVSTLVSDVLLPGSYEANWSAVGFASGVYFYRLQAGSFSQTNKLVLLR